MPPASVAHDHLKQRLLFFVAQDVDDGIRRDVRDFVSQLALRRDWVNGAPCFVNSREEPEDASGEDMPVETVGGYPTAVESLVFSQMVLNHTGDLVRRQADPMLRGGPQRHRRR
jgi:hypothetical protein